jgi:hypothetical protein
MPLSVIGAGYPRTGTMSLKLALEVLDLGPCHHMIELFQHPEQWPKWSKVFDGEAIDWDDVYEGYKSATDAPTCWFYRELAERYPQAKIILSLRSAESWWRSASATVMSAMNRDRMAESPMASLMTKMGAYMVKRGAMGVTGNAPQGAFVTQPDQATAMAAFEAHNAEVQKVIPKDRLLIFQAKDGWGPLCEFLGVPVPDRAYPHVNSTAEFGNAAVVPRSTAGG